VRDVYPFLLAAILIHGAYNAFAVVAAYAGWV